MSRRIFRNCQCHRSSSCLLHWMVGESQTAERGREALRMMLFPKFLDIAMPDYHQWKKRNHKQVAPVYSGTPCPPGLAAWYPLSITVVQVLSHLEVVLHVRQCEWRTTLVYRSSEIGQSREELVRNS